MQRRWRQWVAQNFLYADGAGGFFVDEPSMDVCASKTQLRRLNKKFKVRMGLLFALYAVSVVIGEVWSVAWRFLLGLSPLKINMSKGGMGDYKKKWKAWKLFYQKGELSFRLAFFIRYAELPHDFLPVSQAMLDSGRQSDFEAMITLIRKGLLGSICLPMQEVKKIHDSGLLSKKNINALEEKLQEATQEEQGLVIDAFLQKDMEYSFNQVLNALKQKREDEHAEQLARHTRRRWKKFRQDRQYVCAALRAKNPSGGHASSIEKEARLDASRGGVGDGQYIAAVKMFFERAEKAGSVDEVFENLTQRQFSK